jgi:microcystin-dependent protein
MDEYMGEIRLFPYQFAPMNWAYCQGQSLSVNQYSALFSLIGTQFGGDGRTNFCLPDLRGASPVSGTMYCICVMGMYPSRS